MTIITQKGERQGPYRRVVVFKISVAVVVAHDLKARNIPQCGTGKDIADPMGVFRNAAQANEGGRTIGKDGHQRAVAVLLGKNSGHRKGARRMAGRKGGAGRNGKIKWSMEIRLWCGCARSQVIGTLPPGKHR